MKKMQRNIYLHEFSEFTFKQRFYYVWANELNVSDFNLNRNPLNWCLMDLLKIIYIPILFLVIFPLIIIPGSFCVASDLKSKYKGEEDHGWFISDKWIIE